MHLRDHLLTTLGVRTKLHIKIPGAKEELEKLCYSAAYSMYEEFLPKLIKERLEKELSHIKCHDYESHYMLAKKISDKCREIGALKIMDGCVGNSFVAYLLGISDVNPLPPHGYCRRCKNIEFWDDSKYESGFDIKRIQSDEFLCFDCDNLLSFDGHNLPYEFFMDLDGSKTPDFNFFIEPDRCDEILQFTNGIIEDYVLKEYSVGKYLIVPDDMEFRENASEAVNYFDKIGIYPSSSLKKLKYIEEDIGRRIIEKANPQWYIESMQKIKRISPKAQAIEMVMLYLKLI